jgi:tetratricopeptide (TPR) repeat protein
MKLRALVVLVPSLVLLAPHSARADDALDEARTLYNKATVEYNVGRFQQALELYTKAYERMPRPALLFNIGQCHRLLGHYDQALFFYSGYLREKPEASNRSVVEQHMAEAKQALEQQGAAQAEAQRSAARQSAVSPAQPAHASEPAPSAAAPPQPVAIPPQHSSPVLRIIGLSTAGAGVVLLGTGVALWVHANSVSNELSQVSSQHGTWTSQYQSDYDSGKSAATAAPVLYIVGATAIVGGGLLTWLGWPKRRPANAAIAPLPGGASVSLSGAF